MATSDPGGVHEEGTFHGIYHRDLRVLSRYTLTVDGVTPNVLRAARRGAAQLDTVMATSFDRHGDARAVLMRERLVTVEVRDRYELHRLTPGPPMVVRLCLAADFVDVLTVKDTHVDAVEHLLQREGTHRFVCRAPGPQVEAGLVLTIDGESPDFDGDRLEWRVDTAMGEVWSLQLTLTPGSVAIRRPRVRTPSVALRASGSDHRWERAIEGSAVDLASLQMSAGGERFVAAGAPWFMTLFGRDALLTAYSSLPLGTGQALDTLEALASYQGRGTDRRSQEQPGRILHELRTGVTGVFGLKPWQAYYGTADATPLFVHVLAETARWGGELERIRALLPAARRAVSWCEEYGDIDGDGFVEAVPDEMGIENQGWKDSGDSMVHADGSAARAPIALVEVQAYVYGALTGLAELERRFGESARADDALRSADRLRERFVEAFWSDALNGLVMGLDKDKRPLEVASSNMGHALWTDVLPPEMRMKVAQRVVASDLFGSWGLRTLGSEELAYSPFAYHRGSIWPHDTAIVAHGLARSGAPDGLRRLVSEMLALAEDFDFRLPELLAGTDREQLQGPVPYPVACNPQAWSAAAPLLLLRCALGLEPDVANGVIKLAPTLRDGEYLRVSGLRLGAGELTIDAGPCGVSVEGAEALGLTVVNGS